MVGAYEFKKRSFIKSLAILLHIHDYDKEIWVNFAACESFVTRSTTL